MSAYLHYGLFFAVVTLSIVAAFNRLRGQGFDGAKPHLALVVAAVLCALGWFWIRRAEQQEQASLTSTVAGFAPIYAHETENLGHELIGPDTPDDDPIYVGLIEAQRRWLAANPRVADIYTFHRLDDGSIALWVDSETDYDHDGVYSGEREERTEIGEPYDDASDEVLVAFDGEAAFESDVSIDRWGTWVSAYHPIRDSYGRIYAVLGIDYPADAWVERISAARVQCILQLLLGLSITLAATVWIANMNARLLAASVQERELVRGIEAAELAGRAKSEFLANMSHEIRPPLNGILGMTELLASTPLDATQTEYVQTTRSSATHLLGLVNDVLDFSKIEAGRLELEKTTFSLRDVIGEIAAIVRPKIVEKGIDLTVDIASDLRDLFVGDPTRVRQIVLNLVGNAVKFTEEGSITIFVDSQPTATGASRVRLAVRDTGIGIPPERASVIFDKFTQADSTTTRKFGGSGLGLAIVRELASLMGGEVSVRSKPGLGSEFSVELMLEPAVESALAAPDAPARADVVAKGLRVLLVEDNAVNRRVCEALLDRLGCSVVSAADGALAVEQVRTATFDVILMDCQMPVMDGFEATRAIRALPGPGRDTPILALTADALPEVRERCLALGMNDYVTKPISSAQLAAALARIPRRVERLAEAG